MNKKLLRALIPTILLAAVLIAAVGSCVLGRQDRTNDPTAESRAADYSENAVSESPTDPSGGSFPRYPRRRRRSSP